MSQIYILPTIYAVNVFASFSGCEHQLQLKTEAFMPSHPHNRWLQLSTESLSPSSFNFNYSERKYININRFEREFRQICFQSAVVMLDSDFINAIEPSSYALIMYQKIRMQTLSPAKNSCISEACFPFLSGTRITKQPLNGKCRQGFQGHLSYIWIRHFMYRPHACSFGKDLQQELLTFTRAGIHKDVFDLHMDLFLTHKIRIFALTNKE